MPNFLRNLIRDLDADAQDEIENVFNQLDGADFENWLTRKFGRTLWPAGADI